MNTSGYIRGYMAKNMSGDEFIKVVIRALSREFESQGFVFDRNRSQYIQYCFGNYYSN